MADNDYNNLLNRLNALKTTSQTPRLPTIAKPSKVPILSAEKKQDLDIESRFRRLASGSKLGPTRSSPGAVTPLKDPVDSLPSERVHNLEDDRTLDELLRELGDGGEDPWIDGGGVGRGTVEGLLREAKDILPEQVEERSEQDGDDSGSQLHAKLIKESDAAGEEPEEKQDSDQEDEDAAEEYVAQILADLRLQKELGILDTTEEHEGEDTEADTEVTDQNLTKVDQEYSILDLPSAPATAPIQGDTIDNDLELRMAALSLPSTPSTAPAKRKPKLPHARPPANSLPNYTNEDIESWCVICNEDATLRCLGCDDDLYCSECWNEGHRGLDAQWDEKNHKAVVYTRERKKRALAAT